MVFTFLDFELDEELFELRSGGTVIATQARVFAFIAYLLRQRERVVSKDELMHALWDGNVISDAAISQVVMLARRSLRDDAQRVIKTVRGRGFRFVADVRAKSPPAAVPVRSVPALRAPEPGLLGRAGELEQLLQVLDQARAGRGRLVLIEGEPGIGKSRLAEELAASAMRGGLDPLWGRAWEEGGAPPFWPWIQVLRGLLQRDGPERVRAWAAHARELTQLLPELTRDARRGEPSDSADPRARFRQFDELARLLRYACARSGPRALAAEPGRPRLIILDDLHAVDEASVQLVRFLLPELAEVPLLLLGTLRKLEVAPASALASLLQVQGDAVVSMTLRGLTEPDVSAWLAAKLGRPAPPRWTRALHGLSAGNPLLLAELCNELEGRDQDDLLDLSQLAAYGVPERIAGAVRKHLAGLPDAARSALSSCSVLGREFPVPLAAALCACSEPALLEALAPALARGVLRPSARAAGQLSFSHAVVCSTVYAELAPARRLSLHRQAAELLAQSQPEERLPLYDIAHHYYHAAADGCRDQAIAYARRAAEQAETMRAYEAAAGLYERALQLLELEGVAGELAHELLFAAGQAWYRAGELERALACFDRAAEHARAEHQAERFGAAVLMSSIVMRSTLLQEGSLQQRIRDALAMLPSVDSEVRAGLLAVSTLDARSASFAEREATSRAAVEMARRVADDRALMMALGMRHGLLWGVASRSEALALTDELVALGEKIGDHEWLLDGLLWRIAHLAEFGDWEGAIRERARYVAELERVGSPWHRYMALATYAHEAIASADFARARAASERTLAHGLRVRECTAEACHALRSLFLDYHQGCFGDERPAQAPPSAVPADFHAFWALADAASGCADGARATLSRVLASEAELPDPLRLPTLATMAAVCGLLGDREPAERLYRLLLPGAGRQLSLLAGVYLGPADYYLGMLARLLGERRRAGEHLERAATAPMALFAPYVQFEQAQVLLHGQPAQGVQLLNAALTRAEALGLRTLHAQVSAALGRARGARRIERGQVA